MSDTPTVLRLDEATDSAVAGPKASTVARLRVAGERVPDGFVITTDGAQALDAPALEVEIEEALETIGADRLAVRSSAIAEDLEDQSHAGEYETVLGVKAETQAVLDAARRVVASANGSEIAVLVQTMIDAKVAGVAFSANPVTGDPEIVVSAVAGLGDRLMEGSVTGDQWVVRDGKPVHISGDVLEESLVLDVAELARGLEEGFSHPVDIEWAHDGTNLHLLQSRPITALPVRPDLEIPEGSWQKDATHHAGPVSPLVASLLGSEEAAVTRWSERTGLLIESLEQVSIGGEVYARPIPVGGGDGSAKPPPWWVMGIVARIHPALRKRMATAKRLVQSGALENSGRRWTTELKPEIMALVNVLRAVDVAALDDDALLGHVDDLLVFSGKALDIHFDLFVPYLVAIYELVTGCERLLGWDEDAAMRLLSGHSPASSEPTVALRAVVETINQSTTAMAVVDGTDGGLVERVSAADPESARAIARWIDTYGFRTLDYDWSSPTIAERPGLVGQMIRAEIEGETRLLDHGAAEATAHASLAPDDIAEFDELLARAREAYPAREDNIQWTAMVPGALLRRAHLEIGARLSAAGIIDSADDVFLLEHDEVTGALREENGSLQDLVRRRRAERAWVAAHPGPNQLGEPDGPPPDLRGLPEAGRRINGALMWAIGAEFTPITASDTDGDVITGLPGAAGTHTGTARIVRSQAEFGRVEPGDVVICAITNPSWAVLFGIAGAFVCDAGGPLSHTAVLTREYDIPSVLATGDATRRIADGALVTVDGAAGTVVPATIERV
ncbi:MAG: PEP/pyruvate-binding domain-containing protein [Acidimicrobiia bacterium]|nr:MAG: PEP/pyruvate-binding domain-containing protein [Acidimicrobiia bacterium]